MKVLMESWKDLQNDTDSNDEPEQEAQACVMASKGVMDELFEKYNKCRSKIVALKNENDFLKEKLKEIEVAVDVLEENRFLKSEIAKFKGKQPVSASIDLIAENERLFME
ncbi:hypothetical protein PIB30_032577 [Stylosanthes scabra]|uniref:Uncharacterized protein n=1 Tax=Stylosanthes scabra TaxID=79078 RepID=A0ABU6SBX0_9FABA|nr:hypothetical protein [Stylosanthes scabra]